MERFAALIALLAYLIGGWLAPLLHTHSHGTSCHHQHTEALKHQSDQEYHCCNHDQPSSPAACLANGSDATGHRNQAKVSAGSGIDSEDQEEQLLASEAPFSGLCAICVARISAKERYQLESFSLTLNQQQHSLDKIDATRRSSVLSSHFTRGPPS